MKILAATFITLLLSKSLADGRESSWPLAATEYPPFACEKCPQLGAHIAALKMALSEEKIELKITWLPWTRAIVESRQGHFYAYFPAWPEDCQKGFTFSTTISRSPLVLVERRSHPLKFNKLADLKKYTLGVVQDFGNTLEFKKLIREGTLKTEVVTTDTLNVRKVALGRIDGALIDGNVLRHILIYEHPELKNSVQLNEKIIEMKDLGLCIRDDKATELIAKMKVLFKKHNPEKFVDEYLKKYFKHTDPLPLHLIGSEKKL